MALDTNLVSYWKLDESSGNAADSVGSNTLTNSNTTYAAGKLNNAGIFNGSSSYLRAEDTSNTLDLTNLTISYWLKGESATGARVHFAKGRGGSQGYAAILDGGNYKFVKFGVAAIDSGIVANTTNFQHVVWTVDTDNKPRLYLNGVLVFTSVNTTAITSTSTNKRVYIGAEDSNDGASIIDYSDADIDEVGVWSRALTADEISQIFNSNRALAYPLTAPTLYGGVAYYKLDEASGNAADSIGINTLTNTNVTYEAAKINNGAAYNATGDKLEIADASQVGLDFTGDFSFSFWAYFTGTPSNNCFINKYVATGNQRSYRLYYNGTTLHAGINSDGASAEDDHTATQSISATTWYHLAFTYNSSTKKR